MITVPSIPDALDTCMSGDFLQGGHTLPDSSCPTLHYPPIEDLQGHRGCFAYLTQKVNSSTYYKSRDSRSKDSKEGDGADVLKEVPLGRGNRGTRGQLVSQGSQNSFFRTVPSPRLNSPTKVRAPLPALLAGIPATVSQLPCLTGPLP